MSTTMSEQQFLKKSIIFLIFGVILTLFLVMMGFVNAGTIGQRVLDERNALVESDASTLLQPVGQINVGAIATQPVESIEVAAANINGGQVYQNACMACHAAGIAGAPKTGDIGAWANRIAQGSETLYTHAIGGFQGNAGVMPAKGGNAGLSDDEVKAAVDHMVAQSQ
ncbi:c-type cytochrome [Gammaproteobacteria bacterium]|jgi:cytochrome c5|nr:c-type cytochrome [Gammaproteobacteria bacterium]